MRRGEMHTEALAGVSRAIHWSGIDDKTLVDNNATYRAGRGNKTIVALDLGGADINGTARGAFETLNPIHWTCADIELSEGVDYLFDATGDVPMNLRGAYDIVLCTEVLEHVEKWQAVVSSIYTLLRPGGFAFITCASEGRRPHGARGALDPAPGEWYRNVPSLDLDIQLDALGFADYLVTYNPNPGDAYAWARK